MLDILTQLVSLWCSPELYTYTAPVFALAVFALCFRLICKEY